MFKIKRCRACLLQAGLLCLSLALLLSGCVNISLSADVDPSANLDDIKTIYVRRQEADDKGIEQMIADYLNDIGKIAHSGSGQNPDQLVDAILTYQDRWMWDITMYMLELRIQIRDPESGYAVASGESFRSSLGRKDPEHMVKEVIDEIFQAEQEGE
jgi:hypothetical protein